MTNDIKTIQVSIVEDDNDIRDLLRILIHNTPGFICNDAFPNAELAIGSLPLIESDVVLMDIDLPGISGISCVALLKDQLPNTEFIMLTNQVNEESIFDSLRAGASGYLLKDTPPVKLLDGIRSASEGGAPMSPNIARRVTDYFRPGQTYDLSSRESEILTLLCKGKNYSSIAEILFISGHTVRAHIKNIYTKLHVNSRGEAVSKAIRDRIV